MSLGRFSYPNRDEQMGGNKKGWGSESDPLAASVSHGLYVVLALLEVHQLCLSHQEDLHLWNVGASPPNLHSACTMKLVVNSGFFIAT